MYTVEDLAEEVKDMKIRIEHGNDFLGIEIDKIEDPQTRLALRLLRSEYLGKIKGQ